MTTRPPALAICLPVGMGGVGLQFAARSIAALAAQTCRDFEVVVALDGEPERDAARTAVWDWLAALGATRVVDVRRTPQHPTLAHRNHARNAAWRTATAPLCLMLDADFILPPHAVETILAEHRRLISAGVPAVMSPALSQFGGVSTEEWLARTVDFARWAREPDLFAGMLARWTDIDRGTFSGFGHLARHPAEGPLSDRDPVSTSVGAAMVEGMPILPRKFLEAVGGFDEAYIGWGGDKISLVDVLRGMCAEGIMEIRVLHGVVAMHQPHATDPHHTSDLARRNEHRRQLARMEIDARNLPWRRRVGALGAAMHAGWQECATALGVSGATLGDPSACPPPEIVSAVVTALRSPRLSGQRVVVVGSDAVARACSGQIQRSDVSRGTLGTAEASPAVLVVVSPLPNPLFDDEAAKNGALDGLRDLIGRTIRAGSVVVAQRLPDAPAGGRVGPGHLRPVDMQDWLVKTSTGAQVFRAAGQTWALVTGRV